MEGLENDNGHVELHVYPQSHLDHNGQWYVCHQHVGYQHIDWALDGHGQL